MGQTDIPLNEKGIQQSHDLKNHLKRVKFGRIWSSSLQRASQTSRIINEAFHYPIYDTDLLKERGWGVGEGEPHDHFLPDMKVKFDVKNESKEEKIPQGAESYKAFERRVILAFKKILVPHPLPPLVVSHGGVFQILTNLLVNTTFPAGNCALYFFRPPERPNHPWFINLNST